MDKNYDLTILKDGLSLFGILPEDNQIEQFIRYYELLTAWNAVMNLTAITDWDAVCVKHFLDSVSLCKAVDCTQKLSVVDIGTGAGFPGIPLKIVFPDLQITLLDSLQKRVKFLGEVIDALGLTGIEAVHGRAEDFAKPSLMRERFDLCVSRAVANLSVLSEYCLPYVKKGGFFVSYKSEKAEEEIKAAGKAIELLGGEVYRETAFTLPSSDIRRNLLVIQKVGDTPKKYPRKSGLPGKNPL